MNNTSELERWIAVMQAAKDGKPIEVRTRSCELTWGTSWDPDWNWAQYDYRVKVEPEKVTLWRMVCDMTGPSREDCRSYVWQSSPSPGKDYSYTTVHGKWTVEIKEFVEVVKT